MQIFPISLNQITTSTVVQSNTHHQNTQQSKPSTTITTIPDGFTIGTECDGQQYLVPHLMVPALDQAFAAYQCKWGLNVPNAQGGVIFHF